MQYYGGREMAIGFRTVRSNTITMAQEIDEQHYGFRPAPDVRSIGELLVHIAFVPRLQEHVHQHGVADLAQINFPQFIAGLGAEERTPRNKAQIVELLKAEGEKYATYLEGLTEAFLAEQVAMPPGDPRRSKSRFEMLISPKEHEMHHRGQLMLAQRLIGLVPHMTRARMERAARAAQAR